MKEKILFIINPVSGIGKQKTVEPAIERVLDKERFVYEINYTQYAHHATLLAQQAVQKGFDIVVAVGGDGSINDCVKGLIGTQTKLGILPAGSGNGLARCLHIPLNIDKALEVINSCNHLNMDTVNLNSIPYVSIAGIGFDALIAKEFTGNKTRGLQTYLKLVLNDYASYKPRHYKLLIDDQEIETDALFISFSNSNQFGYNAVIAPKALVNDGLLDVSIVKKVPLALAPIVIQMMFFRQLDKSTYVDTYTAKKVKVLDFHDKLVNLDGEGIEIEDHTLTFNIRPASLSVIIPDEKRSEIFPAETKIAELIKQLREDIDSKITKLG